MIDDIAEKDRVKSNSEDKKKELELKIEFDTIAFFVYLRGEEAPLIVIEGLNMFWKDTQNNRIHYMMMTLKGRFKVENNLRLNCVLLEDQTKSRIPKIRWLSRIIYRRCEL